MSENEELCRFELTFDEERNRVSAVQWGRRTLENFKGFVDAIVGDPRWKLGMSLLADFRREAKAWLLSVRGP